MKTLQQIELNPRVQRVKIRGLGRGTDRDGYYILRTGTLASEPYLRVIVSIDGLGWDHVSVSPSVPGRCPTWEEMSLVRHVFFLPEETVYQIHAPISEHVNHHPWCLHLWRSTREDMPRPPAELVGGA